MGTVPNLALQTLNYCNIYSSILGRFDSGPCLHFGLLSHPDIIERQLARAERSEVRAAYNRAEYLLERKKMMQEWADYLDGVLASPDKVVRGTFGKDKEKRK